MRTFDVVSPALVGIIVLVGATPMRDERSAGQATGVPGVGEEVVAEKSASAPLNDHLDAVSADGRKAAWRAPRGDKWGVMLNGERQGGEFDEVRSLTFGGTGDHLAFCARNGRAWVVVLDGKEGPAFEEIGGLAFSRDGSRDAYTGKREGKWFVVIDGTILEASYEKLGAVAFSADAKRFAFARKSGKWAVVVDGKEMGPPLDDVESIVFSSDGARAAWIGGRGGKRVVVLDGQEGPGFHAVTGLTFSADGRRLAYAGAEIQSGFSGNKGKGRVVIDGQPGPEYEGTKLPLSNPGALDPTNQSFSGLIPALTTSLATSGKLDPVYASHLLYTFHGVSRPVLGRLAARIAYAARRGKNDEVVIVDGQPGTAFKAILGLPVFSADDAHLAFAVSVGDAKQVVVDGTPLGANCPTETDFVTGITFAPDNHRVAYVAVAGGHMYLIGMSPRAKRTVYVDGQPGAQYDARGVLALGFTPDSRHSFYVVSGLEQESGQASVVVIDRTVGKRYDEVYAHTISVIDSNLVYVARSGRTFLRVTQPVQ